MLDPARITISDLKSGYMRDASELARARMLQALTENEFHCDQAQPFQLRPNQWCTQVFRRQQSYKTHGAAVLFDPRCKTPHVDPNRPQPRSNMDTEALRTTLAPNVYPPDCEGPGKLVKIFEGLFECLA